VGLFEFVFRTCVTLHETSMFVFLLRACVDATKTSARKLKHLPSAKTFPRLRLREKAHHRTSLKRHFTVAREWRKTISALRKTHPILDQASRYQTPIQLHILFCGLRSGLSWYLVSRLSCLVFHVLTRAPNIFSTPEVSSMS
jgi:hypothetical protein